MGRHANPDIRRAFSEFQDTDSPSKCLKVKCLHCGYVRAKNTTRQIEHLQECASYLNSPEAATHSSGPEGNNLSPEATRNMLNGTHPNPNLQIHRRGPNQKRKEPPLVPAPARQAPAQPQPSLTHHLLATYHPMFQAATQTAFLSHAGCGTLSSGALTQWMVQDGHYTRAFLQFIGALIGKLRLPSPMNAQFPPVFRTLDLLISALTNIRREMTFFEITAQKYNIHLSDEAPNYVTRAQIDLFQSASAPSASLLEGMIVLWGSEHTYRQAWHYAQTFTNTVSGPPPTESHIAALHNSLIPNWTSPAFSKFVDACRGLVDELAVSPNIANGKEEMERCEAVFKQVCWLTSRSWPEVDGMGEESENGLSTTAAAAAANAAASASTTADENDDTSFAVINGADTSGGAVQAA